MTEFVLVRKQIKKTAEWWSHGKNCNGVKSKTSMSGDTKSVSGAGGTMGSGFGTVSEVLRDDLLMQVKPDGQTNTHWGVPEIQKQKPSGIKSKSNENIRTNCEKLRTSSAPACSHFSSNNASKSCNSRTDTKTLTNQTFFQSRQGVGVGVVVGGLVDDIRNNETLKYGGKTE